MLSIGASDSCRSIMSMDGINLLNIFSFSRPAMRHHAFASRNTLLGRAMDAFLILVRRTPGV